MTAPRAITAAATLSLLVLLSKDARSGEDVPDLDEAMGLLSPNTNIFEAVSHAYEWNAYDLMYHNDIMASDANLFDAVSSTLSGHSELVDSENDDGSGPSSNEEGEGPEGARADPTSPENDPVWMATGGLFCSSSCGEAASASDDDEAPTPMDSAPSDDDPGTGGTGGTGGGPPAPGDDDDDDDDDDDGR